MPVNKGLLFGAAVANGMNAFLDAREKGDLQRQRQAMVDFDKQMKTLQMEQAGQRLDLAGEAQGLTKYKQETDRLRVLAGDDKPSEVEKQTKNASDRFQQLLSSGAFKDQIEQGQPVESLKTGFITDYLDALKLRPSTEEEKKVISIQQKNITDPLTTPNEQWLFGVGSGSRQSDLVGKTPSDPKAHVNSSKNEIVIVDKYKLRNDPERVDVITYQGGQDPEVRMKVVGGLISYKKTILTSSNRLVKGYGEISSAYGVLKAAVQDAALEKQRAKHQGRDPIFTAYDQTITTLFIKMLDPGSVVREQEYKRLLYDMGLTQQFVAKVGNLVHGGNLTPAVRSSVLRMADRIMQVTELRYLRELIGHHLIGEGMAFEDEETPSNQRMAHLITGGSLGLSNGDEFIFKGKRNSELVARYNQMEKDLEEENKSIEGQTFQDPILMAALVGSERNANTGFRRLLSESAKKFNSAIFNYVPVEPPPGAASNQPSGREGISDFFNQLGVN